MIKVNKIFAIFAAFVLLSLTACNSTESYSELFKEEERATNWYLSNYKVENELPEGSEFIEGSDAPFYKMDNDGYIYMQVVNSGDKNDMIKTGDVVYFRFMRTNIKYLYEDIETSPEGNADDLSISATSFVYGDYSLTSSSKYGSGIQLPLAYLGNNSEVNLVLRSYYGFSTDQSQCIPYIINVKYFKAEY